MFKILKSYTITELRKEISKTNIKGYSKLKKPELIELMMQSPEKFSHLEMKAKKERSEKQKANDKLLGEKAKARLAKKKEPVKEPEPEPVKEEVKEVKSGFECGIMLENYSDIKIGDVIETYAEVKTERKL